jgi:hypothetical protein
MRMGWLSTWTIVYTGGASVVMGVWVAGGFGCDAGPKNSITNPAKTQLGAAAAASYVANQLYDGMSAVYMYLAGKGDTANKPRRDKEAKQRATGHGFSAEKT